MARILGSIVYSPGNHWEIHSPKAVAPPRVRSSHLGPAPVTPPVKLATISEAVLYLLPILYTPYFDKSYKVKEFLLMIVRIKCRKGRVPLMEDYGDWQPVVKVTKVYAKGRTQIPAEIRKVLGIKDGDKIVWLQIKGNYCIQKL